LCDGSVRYLSNSIDTAMHRAIHSRDGREPVSSF